MGTCDTQSRDDECRPMREKKRGKKRAADVTVHTNKSVLGFGERAAALRHVLEVSNVGTAIVGMAPREGAHSVELGGWPEPELLLATDRGVHAVAWGEKNK